MVVREKSIDHSIDRTIVTEPTSGLAVDRGKIVQPLILIVVLFSYVINISASKSAISYVNGGDKDVVDKGFPMICWFLF